MDLAVSPILGVSSTSNMFESMGIPAAFASLLAVGLVLGVRFWMASGNDGPPLINLPRRRPSKKRTRLGDEHLGPVNSWSVYGGDEQPKP